MRCGDLNIFTRDVTIMTGVICHGMCVYDACLDDLHVHFNDNRDVAVETSVTTCRDRGAE